MEERQVERRSQQSTSEIDSINRIIAQDDVDALVSFADSIAEELVSADIRKHQIRNLFDSIKRIEMEGFSLRKLTLLKPKMEHTVSQFSGGRKRAMEKLKTRLSDAIDKVKENPEESEERFERFIEFFEAILCYHSAKKSGE